MLHSAAITHTTSTPMKHFLLTLMAIASWLAGSAQLTGIVVETYDPTIVAPMYVAPAGMTTYRVYAEFESPLDKVSSLFGLPTIEDGVVTGPCQPLKIETTTSWYNDNFGTSLGSSINSGFFIFVPSLAADSWLTIGVENSTDFDGGQVNYTLGIQSAIIASFNTVNGSSFIVNNGSVHTFFNSTNGFGSGPNNRVLLAQLTTTGQISFELNLSVYLGNNIANEVSYVSNMNCEQGSEFDVDGAPFGLIYQGPPVFLGCTDPTALNYDDEATINDGTCVYAQIFGCTDPTALNYDELATDDDGSCQYPVVLGCTDPTALNYNELAMVDDGSCQYLIISGCTDPTATNFNPNAEEDDGSCIYPIDCSGLATVEITTAGGAFPDEIYWQIIDEDNNIVASGGAAYGAAVQQACLADGCYMVEMTDSFGDGWNGGSISITLDDLVIFTSNGPETDYTSAGMGVNVEGCPNVQEPPAGCTDPTADNYNPLAITDNGSCIYNNGCLFLNAVEFTIEPGSSPEELIWIILNPNGTVATSGVGVAGGYSELICLSDGCYTALLYDSFGDGWNGGAITISLNGNVVATSTGPAAAFDDLIFGLNADCSEVEAILGCTDPAANNYNSQANEDDGSCTYDGLYEGPMAALEDVGPDIYLYPNPTGGDVTVDIFGANGAEALIVTVNDLMGRIIFQRNYGNDQERLRINLESSAYASGVYLLTVQNGAHATTHRLVKQ